MHGVQTQAFFASALSMSVRARVLRKHRREKAALKLLSRMDQRRAYLAARIADGRTQPVDAITLEPVMFDRPKTKRAQRLFGTASKFKQGHGRARPQASPEPEPDVSIVSIDKQLRWQIAYELERNRRAVPKKWDARQVDLWLQAAYETLYRLPIKIWPKAYGSCMPTPTEFREVDWADAVAQASNEDGEELPPLFGMARLRTLGMPEKYEIDRMTAALQWPTQYLLHEPLMAACVGHSALWAALDVSFNEKGFRKLCRRKFHCRPEEFDRARGFGLTVIAGGLNHAVAQGPPRGAC